MSNSNYDKYDDDDEDVDGYVKIDRYNPELIKNISTHYKDILKQLGEDPEREGLLKTPERVAKSLLYLTHGYDLNPKDILECVSIICCRFLARPILLIYLMGRLLV
jgi:GTP cyclohydrolase I